MPAWLTDLPLQLPLLPLPLETLLVVTRAIVLTAALVVCAWAFRRWRHAQQVDTQRVFEQLDLIQGELHGLAEQFAAISGRIEGLADRLTAQAEAMPVQAAPVVRGYETAIRLAQRGNAAEDLMTQCGLARHEAELLVRLHGRVAEPSQAVGGDPADRRGGTASPPGRSRLSVVG